MSKPAARITDFVVHPLPPLLTGGLGSPDVLIGGLPAWRGVPAAVAMALQSAKTASDTAIKTAETATLAAAGTPGAPVAKAAEETTKSTAAATMGNAITSGAGGADIHNCATPLPIPPHGPGVVIDGSATVLINGFPACRMGDTILEAIGPPNKIAGGCPTVLIGGGSISPPTMAKPGMDFSRFDETLDYMYDEMITNAQSDDVKQIQDLLNYEPSMWDLISDTYDPLALNLAALSIWADKVHSGADWDHKPKLEEKLGLANPPDYWFPIRGDDQHEYFYDIWSNIHYGYVGSAAGFSSDTLQEGADLGDAFTGVNDGGDVLSTQIGIDLWNEYGLDLTKEQLHQAILDNTDNYLNIQQQEPQVNIVISPTNRK
jgi:uncharacterized Zn-binding protein involved in type VI secretion